MIQGLLEDVIFRRYQELMLNQVLQLLYEKGILSKERHQEMHNVITDLIREEVVEALNAARDE